MTFCTYDWPKWVGGPNTLLRRLLPALSERGADPEVLVIYSGLARECPFLGWLEDGGYRHRAIRMQTYTEDRVWSLLRHLSTDPPDVFVANLSVSAYFAGRWARDGGIATVGVVHSDEDYYRQILEEFAFNAGEFRLSAIACVSRFLTEYAGRRANGVLAWRVPIGVPVPPAAVSAPAETLRLLYVGRFVERQKRITRVAEWLCKAVAATPGVEAILLGDGPERAAVEATIRRFGPGLAVRMGGWCDADGVEAQIREGHGIVLLSDYEGLPIAMLEGMASGLVPISTRIRSGVPELVEDGVTGFLVDDEASFVQAVTRLRNDKGLWSTLSANARRRIQREYAIDAMASAWMQLFEELLREGNEKRPLVIPSKLQLPAPNAAFVLDDGRRPGIARYMASRAYRFIRNALQRGEAPTEQ